MFFQISSSPAISPQRGEHLATPELEFIENGVICSYENPSIANRMPSCELDSKHSPRQDSVQSDCGVVDPEGSICSEIIRIEEAAEEEERKRTALEKNKLGKIASHIHVRRSHNNDHY